MDNSRKWPAFVIGHLWDFCKATINVNCKVESDKEWLILELFSNKPFCYDVIHDKREHHVEINIKVTHQNTESASDYHTKMVMKARLKDNL